MSMTIGALIERLTWDMKKHGNVQIICAKDAEGNGYNFVRGVDFVYADPNGGYEIEYVYDSIEEYQEDNDPDQQPSKLALLFV